jgi:putative Ca2+/H+ antiporter (TMEM165/GDT1 family)
MLQTVLSSFALVSVSEFGDKTQLLAFSLAARYKKPWPILSGIFLATTLNHTLASLTGVWISSHFSHQTLAMILGLTFILFGIWTLKPDSLDIRKNHPKFGVFFTTSFLFFLSEMGDKTQFATMALAAKFHSPWAVTLGTTAGMMITDGLAVFLGERLSNRVQMKWIRIVAASLFFIFGFTSLVSSIAK